MGMTYPTFLQFSCHRDWPTLPRAASSPGRTRAFCTGRHRQDLQGTCRGRETSASCDPRKFRRASPRIDRRIHGLSRRVLRRRPVRLGLASSGFADARLPRQDLKRRHRTISAMQISKGCTTHATQTGETSSRPASGPLRDQRIAYATSMNPRARTVRIILGSPPPRWIF